MSYTLTITRGDGSVLKTLEVEKPENAHAIAYLWDKEMGYKTTSVPPIEYLGVQKHKPAAKGREPRHLRVVK